MRNPVRNHRNSLAARQEPNLDDLFKTPRRKRKPARAGLLTRFSARGAVDFLAVSVAIAAILLVFVNALGLQKASNATRISPPATHEIAASPGCCSASAAASRARKRSRPNRSLARCAAELASRGYYDGAVDGAAGPRISQAIRDFEITQRLRVTGEASEILLGQIRKAGNKSDITGSVQPSKPVAGNPQILSAQRLLARYGYGPIHISGAADKETHEAIERFERDHKMPATGEISERLMRELASFSGGSLD